MRVICILALLVLNNIILAQSIPSPWEKQYNFQEYDFAADMCAGYDGGAVIVGGDWEDTNYSDMRCRVTRLSGSGRQLWTWWYDFGDNYPVYEGVCRNESRETYVVVGTHDYNVGDRELILGEFDDDGDLVQTEWYDNYERGIDIIQTEDGGYAALVLKKDEWDLLHVYVKKVDEDLDEIWETELDLTACCLIQDNLQPGNGLCLSYNGDYILAGYTYCEIVGIYPNHYYFPHSCVNSLASDDGEVVAVSFLDTDLQYVGIENNTTQILQEYVVLSNSLDGSYGLPIENTDEFIVMTTYTENLNFVDSVHVGPPGSYIGIRAYEFEKCSGGYMITGMVLDASYQWHMWIGKTNNSFQLQDSYYGSANTGSFGEVLSSCNQMGGCVTEAGHFMAAGAEYLPTGHTNYNVMFESILTFDSGDTSSELGVLEGSTDGLSVYSNSDLNHFSIQFHGEMSGEPVADVYNISGRKVTTLHGSRNTEDSFSFTFDGNSSEGFQLPSGVYVVTVNTGNSIEAASFTLLQ